MVAAASGRLIGRLVIVGACLAIVMAGCAEASVRSTSPASQSILEADVPETPNPTPVEEPSPEPTRMPTPTATPLPVPPKPTGVAFHERIGAETEGGYATIAQRVTWKAPRTKGVEIRVYGVTECLSEPDPLPTGPASGPCLVKGTRLPASVRTLLATAPSSDGVARWRWTEQTGCNWGLESDNDGPPLYAIVLAAYNESGNSIFAIAEPGEWYVAAPDEVIC
jgi:hypothetical protein